LISGNNMPFTFVDAGAPDGRDNRRKIRKHLSVFHALQRRQRDVLKQRNAAELISTSVVATGPLAWRLKDEEEDEEDLDDPERACRSGRSQSSSNTSLQPGIPRVQNITAVTGVLIDYTSGSPKSLMSAARTDPFSTYPIPADAETHATVDFFIHDLGPYLYGYARNDSVDIFRHRGFPIASRDPAAFHANMLMASINLDILKNRSLPGMRALRHRVEAVRLINERLAVPTKYLDESTLYTIITLTGLEQIWGAIGHNEVHSGSLEQVLIKCGGLKALRKYPLLEHTLYSICLVVPKILSFGILGLYSGDNPHHSPREERRAVAAELVELLQSTTSRSHSWPLSMLAFAFQPGSPLHETMMSPAYDLSKSNSRHSSEAAERSHLAILLRFHCVLRRLPEHAEVIKLVAKLNALIRDAWIWQNSLAMVQYMIVKADDSAGLEAVSLAWHVLRLVEICGLLSNATYQHVKQYLFILLCQSEDYPRLDLQAIQRELDALC
jgi:hypothetical protein